MAARVLCQRMSTFSWPSCVSCPLKHPRTSPITARTALPTWTLLLATSKSPSSSRAPTRSRSELRATAVSLIVSWKMVARWEKFFEFFASSSKLVFLRTVAGQLCMSIFDPVILIFEIDHNLYIFSYSHTPEHGARRSLTIRQQKHLASPSLILLLWTLVLQTKSLALKLDLSVSCKKRNLDLKVLCVYACVCFFSSSHLSPKKKAHQKILPMSFASKIRHSMLNLHISTRPLFIMVHFA